MIKRGYCSFSFPFFPAVYYQQQQQQQQQPQQSQQPQAAVPTVVAPGAPHSQPRESTGSRRLRSCAIPIVDPNTNRNILTGEELQSAAPAVSTPTAEASAVLCAAEIAASSSQEAARAAVEPAVVAVAVVEAAAEVVSSDAEKETPVEPATTAPAEEDSLKTLEVAPVEVTVAPTPASATEATEPTSEAPVQVEEEVAVEAPAMPAAAAAAAVSASPALEPAIEIEPLPVTQENGELPSVSGPPSSSGSPTLVSTSASPEIGEGELLFSFFLFSPVLFFTARLLSYCLF